MTILHMESEGSNNVSTSLSSIWLIFFSFLIFYCKEEFYWQLGVKTVAFAC